MSTLNIVQLLWFSLALVMAGLGLSLRPGDFRRLRDQRRGVLAALVAQMVVLPLVAFLIAVGFQLPPAIGVGLILLAATPGSVSSNLYSHVFGGNVAFNVALTGLNTLLCAVTLPFVTAFAIATLSGGARVIPIQWDRAFGTIALVVIPVVVGMFVAARAPAFASRVVKPVKILSLLIIVGFSVGGIIKEWTALSTGFASIGASLLVFNGVALAVGYGCGRLANLDTPHKVTLMFQVSVHNAIQAIYVALVVLESTEIALPAAIYSITMNLFALVAGFVLTSRLARGPSATDEILA